MIEDNDETTGNDDANDETYILSDMFITSKFELLKEIEISIIIMDTIKFRYSGNCFILMKIQTCS